MLAEGILVLQVRVLGPALLLLVPHVVIARRFVPQVGAVSLAQYKAAGVPVVSCKNLSLSAVGFPQVSEFCFCLFPSNLILFIHGFLCFGSMLCSLSTFST